MSFRFGFKISFGHLQDVLAGCLACLGKASLRHLVDVFLPTGYKPLKDFDNNLNFHIMLGKKFNSSLVPQNTLQGFYLF